MNKIRKVKASRFDGVPEHRLIMRFAEVRDHSEQGEKAVTVVIATENPVEKYDTERGIVLREVLSMNGVSYRGGRRQLPIVDSHDRSTVANVLGSVRNLRVDKDELIGDAYFASDEESQRAYQKLKDGHLTDFSITATPKESTFVERGQIFRTSQGEEVSGPAEIVTNWMPTDASLCATGADERSVVRRMYLDLPLEKTRMNADMVEKLQAAGLPEALESRDEILKWVEATLGGEEKPEEDAAPAEEPVEVIESMEEEKEEVEKGYSDDKEIKSMSESEDDEKEKVAREDDSEEKEDEIKKAVDRALKNEKKRTAEIVAAVKKVGLPQTFADELCRSDISLSEARGKILSRMSNEPVGTTMSHNENARVVGSEQDNFYKAAQSSMLQRGYACAGLQRQLPEADLNVARELKGMRLLDLARVFAERQGFPVQRMAPRDIAMAALNHEGTFRRHNIQRAGYHTTGSFPNLLLDATNKTLLAAYEEAPYTWNRWARQAAPVADFKDINRIRYSEVPNLGVVPERSPYAEQQMSDNKESYSIEKFGGIFSVSWETIVGDDLDAISRTPAKQGVAARRTQNNKVYEVLTANGALSDGGALFNNTAQSSAGGHDNLAGGAALSVASLNAAFLSMMTKKGLNQDVILNIQPTHLIVPAALGGTAMQLLNSVADPAQSSGSNEDASRPAFNANVANIYGPNGSRGGLQLIVEPELDGNSQTAWYLAASNLQVDTVELSFLQGEESPVLEDEWDFERDCYKYKIRQSFGVAAIDFRGLYKNPGA